MGAWYDIFQGGTLRNYVRLKTEAGTDAARKGQRLLVYIGGHAGVPRSHKVGGVEFGDKAPFDLDDAMLRWYDWLLKRRIQRRGPRQAGKNFCHGQKRMAR